MIRTLVALAAVALFVFVPMALLVHRIKEAMP